MDLVMGGIASARINGRKYIGNSAFTLEISGVMGLLLMTGTGAHLVREMHYQGETSETSHVLTNYYSLIRITRRTSRYTPTYQIKESKNQRRASKH